MSDHESFEDRLRAIAKEITRSVERMAQLDIDEVAESFGVDPNRAREFADAATQWLNEHMEGDVRAPFFGQERTSAEDAAPNPAPAADVADPDDIGDVGDVGAREPVGGSARLGPHPLDRPTEAQGRALSALGSGRWSVRAGSAVLRGSGVGDEPPTTPGLVGELRARDWITTDGELTLVGRHALRRWYSADPADSIDAAE